MFFSIWVLFHEYSRFTRQQEKGEAISLYHFYHFHLFHRHLYISRVIAAESSPLRTSAHHEPLSITRSLEFTYSTLAVVAVVVRRMLKTRVTLGNISHVLLNLIKRLIFVMFNVLALTFVPFSYLLVSVMMCIFNCEEFIYGTFEDCFDLCKFHYCSSYFRISAR